MDTFIGQGTKYVVVLYLLLLILDLSMYVMLVDFLLLNITHARKWTKRENEMALENKLREVAILPGIQQCPLSCYLT